MLRQICPVLVLSVILSGTLIASDATERAALEKAIDQHRKGTITMVAAPGAEVQIEQLRHEFWFGAAISSGVFSQRADSVTTEKYKEVFLKSFNAAVTENALKWHAMEHNRGQIDYSIVDAILAWTEQHDMPLRGHNIFWGIGNRVPSWQKSLTDDELLGVVEQRARTIGERYRGRFAEYDLNNEMMHQNYYEERLGPEITRQMAVGSSKRIPARCST